MQDHFVIGPTVFETRGGSPRTPLGWFVMRHVVWCDCDMYEYSNSRTTFTFSKRERDHNDKNEHIMGNGNNDAKAGKQKQQKLLIFRLLGHEWVGQGPGVELCEHGQVDGASITANQPLDCVQHKRVGIPPIGASTIADQDDQSKGHVPCAGARQKTKPYLHAPL